MLAISQEAGATLIIITNALGIPVRIPLEYLADRYTGPLNWLIPCVVLCSILMFAWAAVHTVAELYVFVVFYGLASAAAMALFVATLPSSLTKDLDKIGTRVGMALTMISLGPLTGPSVAGTLIARTGGEYLRWLRRCGQERRCSFRSSLSLEHDSSFRDHGFRQSFEAVNHLLTMIYAKNRSLSYMQYPLVRGKKAVSYAEERR